jgi:uncharacterized protein
LVHISHISDKFIKDPKEVVAVQQKVKVTVVEVDIARKRIGLSMKSDPFADQVAPAPKQKTGPKENNAPRKDFRNNRPNDRTKEKPKEKEISMEEKLAMLVNKFKK